MEQPADQSKSVSNGLRQMEESFQFLELPTELRIQIYHYSLQALYPICYTPGRSWKPELRIDRRETLGTSLLYTCKQLRNEGSQIFYGENEFRFGYFSDIIDIPDAIPAVGFQWLQEITMPIPLDWSEVIGYTAHLQRTLDTLCNAPRLRRLNLFFVDEWLFPDFQIMAHTKWNSFKAFLRLRPTIQTTAILMRTRIPINGIWSNKTVEWQNFQNSLKYQVGVWDQRHLYGYYCPALDWKIPEICTEDPDDYLRDIRALFQTV